MLRRFIASFVLVAFITSSIKPVMAQSALSGSGQFNVAQLPAPGSMMSLTPAYAPVLIKGLKIHPENPLLFDFVLDGGQSGFKIDSPAFRSESEKLIKYFLTAMTIKEDDLWVNLSPYEKDRMVPKELGQTEMGRDMLAQDYILKQLTASLIYPEKSLGKTFWDKIYAKARQMYGASVDIPVNTFNKVWIVADKAKVLERNNVGFVIGAHLKVMLEEDYLALSKNVSLRRNEVTEAIFSNDKKIASLPTGARNDTNKLGSEIIREIILPQLEKEVNQGQNFAPLRQIFYSMILATWYKQAVKEALLNQVYSNKSKIAGVQSDDPAIKDKIYQQYLKAYKKGVFNYIKEDLDASSRQTIPRKYFSGGLAVHVTQAMLVVNQLNQNQKERIEDYGPLAVVTVGAGIVGLSSSIPQDPFTWSRNFRDSFGETLPDNRNSNLGIRNYPIGVMTPEQVLSDINKAKDATENDSVLRNISIVRTAILLGIKGDGRDQFTQADALIKSASGITFLKYHTKAMAELAARLGITGDGRKQFILVDKLIDKAKQISEEFQLNLDSQRFETLVEIGILLGLKQNTSEYLQIEKLRKAAQLIQMAKQLKPEAAEQRLEMIARIAATLGIEEHEDGQKQVEEAIGLIETATNKVGRKYPQEAETVALMAALLRIEGNGQREIPLAIQIKKDPQSISISHELKLPRNDALALIPCLSFWKNFNQAMMAMGLPATENNVVIREIQDFVSQKLVSSNVPVERINLLIKDFLLGEISSYTVQMELNKLRDDGGYRPKLKGQSNVMDRYELLAAIWLMAHHRLNEESRNVLWNAMNQEHLQINDSPLGKSREVSLQKQKDIYQGLARQSQLKRETLKEGRSDEEITVGSPRFNAMMNDLDVLDDFHNAVFHDSFSRLLGAQLGPEFAAKPVDVGSFRNRLSPNAAMNSAPDHSGKPGALLIVDDTPILLLSSKLVAQTELPESQVFTAQSGEQALEMLLEHPEITHVYTDTDMPGIQGYELARMIREDERFKNRRIKIGAKTSAAVAEPKDKDRILRLYREVDPEIGVGFSMEPGYRESFIDFVRSVNQAMNVEMTFEEDISLAKHEQIISSLIAARLQVGIDNGSDIKEAVFVKKQKEFRLKIIFKEVEKIKLTDCELYDSKGKVMIKGSYLGFHARDYDWGKVLSDLVPGLYIQNSVVSYDEGLDTRKQTNPAMLSFLHWRSRKTDIQSVVRSNNTAPAIAVQAQPVSGLETLNPYEAPLNDVIKECFRRTNEILIKYPSLKEHKIVNESAFPNVINRKEILTAITDPNTGVYERVPTGLRLKRNEGGPIGRPMEIGEEKFDTFWAISGETKEVTIRRFLNRVTEGASFLSERQHRSQMAGFLDHLQELERELNRHNGVVTTPQTEGRPLTTTRIAAVLALTVGLWLAGQKSVLASSLPNHLPFSSISQIANPAHTPGGIALNARNMALDVAKDGKGIEMQLDPVLVAEFRRGNFSGVVPIIIRIVPLQSPLPMLGLNPDLSPSNHA